LGFKSLIGSSSYEQLNLLWVGVAVYHSLSLQGASFVDIKQLREAIDHFISAYNEQAAPFEMAPQKIVNILQRILILFFALPQSRGIGWPMEGLRNGPNLTTQASWRSCLLTENS
jgi:hypothetical protein